MESLKQFLFPLVLAVFALARFQVHAQDQTGFISIDCGANSSYSEETTTINYISDKSFIVTGKTHSIAPAYQNGLQQAYLTLRSFPNGTRNCYRINVTGDSKYIIRAYFYYGNYDGENNSPKFDLHLGPNYWATISFKSATDTAFNELIHYIPAKRNYVHVCLVNTGFGVPIISKIELRLLPNETYQTEMGSLEYLYRRNTGQSTDSDQYRYPNDIYDRHWVPYQQKDWTQLKTSSPINIDNHYKPASVVMSTAATPIRATDNLTFSWEPDNESQQFYVYMHFAELEKLPGNQSRQLEIYINGELFQSSFQVAYLVISTIYRKRAIPGESAYTINVVGKSDLPPILNAIEVYKVKVFSEAETDIEDVNAITTIKSTYKIEKNWQGDPCSPKEYSWEGLTCRYPQNDFPRIISLDLSSSGLTGQIDASFVDLAMLELEILDLSNNNLTGPIPDYLSTLKVLRLCDNTNLSGNISCKKKKKKQSLLIPITGSTVGISVLLLAVLGFFCCQKTRQPKPPVEAAAIELEPTKRNFTYAEILKITNNRQRILGRGGFGTVYHGYIDQTQVAVKLLSSTSSQGLQEFHAEVHLLLRVHHRNLTILVGYCNDENNKGLIYEYMSRGNLQQSLSDRSSYVLTWEGRLQIAADAATGLEYLHYGCKPPMIHRDVKTTNILLSENFQAKLSDFGLSRNFPSDDRSHIITGVAGTPGYLAPEYKQLNKFNEKSDVYSFGIVLLEIITGRPAISKTRDKDIAINEWVGSIIQSGDIETIVDPRLHGNFDTNLAWKFVEVAMSCVNPEPSKRPTMCKVVGELKQCLDIQLAQTTQSGYNIELGNTFDSVSGNGYTITMPSVR